LFGGMGDCRNVFSTLTHIFNDRVQGKVKGQSFHLTLVDIKPAVIARDLVILLLLDDLSKVRSKTSLLIPCLYYPYLSPIMPSRPAALLQERIQRTIDILKDKQPPPAYFDIPHLHGPEVLRVLKQWQHDASARLPVSKMRQDTISQRRSERMEWDLHHSYSMGPMPAVRPGWKLEQQFYEQTGVLTIPKPYDAVYGKEIRSAFEASSSRKIEQKNAVAEKVEADWASNVTMIDLDWVEAKRRLDGTDIDVAHDPWQLGAAVCDRMPMESGARLYDFVSTWFAIVAEFLNQLKGDMKIEVCLGNITTVLEQIRCGVIGRRQRSHAHCDPEVAQGNDAIISEGDEYPRVYDRIHLSNVPDYIGGTLASFLYVLPLTHSGDSSYITSTCLRNPPRWKSEAHFHNEYVGLSAPSDLAKVFRVHNSGSHDSERDKFPQPMNGGYIMSTLRQERELIALLGYRFWHHLDRHKTFANLMPRERLETWLYRLFLKLVIPAHKRSDLLSSQLNRFLSPTLASKRRRISSTLAQRSAGQPTRRQNQHNSTSSTIRPNEDQGDKSRHAWTQSIGQAFCCRAEHVGKHVAVHFAIRRPLNQDPAHARHPKIQHQRH
jgi:hypothetical protein